MNDHEKSEPTIPLYRLVFFVVLAIFVAIIFSLATFRALTSPAATFIISPTFRQVDNCIKQCVQSEDYNRYDCLMYICSSR